MWDEELKRYVHEKLTCCGRKLIINYVNFGLAIEELQCFECGKIYRINPFDEENSFRKKYGKLATKC